MDRRRQVRPPARHTRPPVRRPVRRQAERPRSVERPPVKVEGRRKRKPRRDITLSILDFFANIGRGIKRGYLRARTMRHFRTVSTFVALIFAISAAILVFSVATRPNALEIYLDGGTVPVGVVRMDGGRQVTPEYITRHATARLETQLGSHVRLVSEIEANPLRIGTGTAALTFDNLITALVNSLDYYVWGAIIIVDGAPSAALSSSNAAESLLSDIAGGLRQGGGAMSFQHVFAQEVEIENIYVRRQELMTRDAAYRALTTPREVPGFHIIQRGETFWSIGLSIGMSESDLIAANPGVDYTALQVGQRIAVVRTVPVLSAAGD